MLALINLCEVSGIANMAAVHLQLKEQNRSIPTQWLTAPKNYISL